MLIASVLNTNTFKILKLFPSTVLFRGTAETRQDGLTLEKYVKWPRGKFGD